MQAKLALFQIRRRRGLISCAFYYCRARGVLGVSIGWGCAVEANIGEPPI